MSIAIKTPPGRSDDRDAQFINYQEEFRRAKRNSLTWSALTLVASMASPVATGEQGTFRIYGTDLAVEQPVLIALLLCASLFFFLAYIRNLGVVRSLNSAAAVDADKIWASARDMLEGIEKSLTEPFHSAKDAEKSEVSLSNLITQFAARLDDLAMLRHTIIEVDELNAKSAARNYLDTVQRNPHHESEVQLAEKRLVYAVDERFRRSTEHATSIINELADFKDDIETHERARIQHYARAVEAVERLEKSLSRFRSAVTGREKAWHIALDKVAVIGLYAFSSTLGLAEIIPAMAGAIGSL
ncbi:hypothetical protein [Qipengyuania huizhouensis]|uniref:hypothetical protein n=1 Tax=Qipengyuania huizhouensis TaxID=2867245 RepID=UPI001C883405|nr:hypothetical protein [Qipengyuania huizhouensis]MBX7459541.1 hypothetical protein [Qipengyuania huizhouensis]